MKKIVTISIVSGILSGLAGSWLFNHYAERNTFISLGNDTNTPYTHVSSRQFLAANVPSSFADASQKAIHSVVFIKTITQGKMRQRDPFSDFWNFDFFGQRGPVSSSGSGVIISDDGYIVTNNHVVDDADDIEVILNNNKRSFKAKVIGTDPSTDLALLKINTKDLPKILFGNSDDVRIGDWVLAVGNPFNLTSTVTAGIVSAKGRNISIVNSSFPIESFIQTDAAINPGNSGGALIDINGNLVGINTAIASNNGSYNGYGFAIPVNMVAKIITDLKQHGEVQRGFTGMEFKDIDATLADKVNLQGNAGVYIEQVMEDGPASKAGLEAGDIIIKADGKIVESRALLDEQISLHRPGETLKITYIRGSKTGEANLTLINKEGNTTILRKYTFNSTILGSDLTPLSKVEKDKYGVTGGIKITNLRGGRLSQMGLQEGTIITKFNGKVYTKPQELEEVISNAKGSISIEAISPGGGKAVYNFFSY